MPARPAHNRCASPPSTASAPEECRREQGHGPEEAGKEEAGKDAEGKARRQEGKESRQIAGFLLFIGAGSVAVAATVVAHVAHDLDPGGPEAAARWHRLHFDLVAALQPRDLIALALVVQRRVVVEVHLDPGSLVAAGVAGHEQQSPGARIHAFHGGDEAFAAPAVAIATRTAGVIRIVVAIA